jgi:FMN phosphatase YigB (HAD superfamily)
VREVPVDLVVFDLGGVLVRIVRSWTEAHARAGLPSHPITESAEFAARRAELAHAYGVAALTADAYLAAVAEASRGVYTPADVRRILELWQYAEYPRSGEVLDAVERAGVEAVALSNTNDTHWPVLRPASGVPAYPTVARFRRAYASHELGLAKPDPAVFAAVEADTGHAAAGILFFDDTAEYVEAARAHGWRAEVIDPLADPSAQLLALLQQYGVA